MHSRPPPRGDTHATIIHATPYPNAILEQIRDKVDDYMDRVLDDYKDFGITVYFEKGRARIGPALMKKNPEFESSYYYASADRRSHKGLVTVKRDSQGLQADVQLLEELLERPQTTEREMQRFFEEHPSILMQARLGIPIVHPRYREFQMHGHLTSRSLQFQYWDPIETPKLNCWSSILQL
jgi:hypothetical protein